MLRKQAKRISKKEKHTTACADAQNIKTEAVVQISVSLSDMDRRKGFLWQMFYLRNCVLVTDTWFSALDPEDEDINTASTFSPSLCPSVAVNPLLQNYAADLQSCPSCVYITIWCTIFFLFFDLNVRLKTQWSSNKDDCSSESSDLQTSA